MFIWTISDVIGVIVWTIFALFLGCLFAVIKFDTWRRRRKQDHKKHLDDSVHKKAAQFTEETCPGHVASDSDPKVCGRCGLHIDSLR